ncbi:hypothetical protein QYF61_018692 [Mycteria americana]|uniref:C-X-C motif chemokine n=1 Tax=Mycteria americana TaxID=33587 RepID=A0AAN7MZ39_MYCAM|nr:hypothetical protein QYF61_018692 [Mycteria americana]
MGPHLRLVLVLVLLLAAALCRGAPLAGELRCRCVRTVSEVIPPRRLARVELVAEGPHCAVPEVIATTKQGQTVCLNPSAPWVKLIVTRILNRYRRGSAPRPGPAAGVSREGAGQLWLRLRPRPRLQHPRTAPGCYTFVNKPHLLIEEYFLFGVVKQSQSFFTSFCNAEEKGLFISVSTSIFQAYECEENLGWAKFNLHILVSKRQSVPVRVPTAGSLALLGSPRPAGDKSTGGQGGSPNGSRSTPPPALAMGPHLRLVLVLLLAAALCRGAPLAGELRCRCVRTVSEVIPPRRLARVELVAEGPHCAVPEVIATTKQGQTVCLNPSAPWVKLIVTRILNRYRRGPGQLLLSVGGRAPRSSRRQREPFWRPSLAFGWV